MFLQWITPPEEMIPQGPLVYPFHRMQGFFRQLSGDESVFTVNNYQLQAIPRYVVSYIGLTQAAKSNIASGSAYLSDTYIPFIQNINFNNQNALLSNAQVQDFWRMARECGSCQTWPEFSGYAKTNIANGADELVTLTTGPVHCYEFGRHISLGSGSLTISSPGQFNYQANVTVQAPPGDFRDLSQFEFVTIFIFDHELVMDDGGSVFIRYPPLLDQAGMGGAADGDDEVVEVPWDSHMSPSHGAYGGSVIGDKIKNFFKGVWNWIKNNKVISKVANAVGPALSGIPGPVGMIGGPVASFIGKTAQNLGVGGSAMNSSQLRARIQAL